MKNKPQYTECTKKKDLLTGKMIYTTFDEPAINEGGFRPLFRAFENINLEIIPNGASTKFVIEFMVDVDGKVSRERVIKDEVGNVGNQMLKIIKSFKWIPAMCNGKKVASLHTIPLQICLQ